MPRPINTDRLHRLAARSADLVEFKRGDIRERYVPDSALTESPQARSALNAVLAQVKRPEGDLSKGTANQWHGNARRRLMQTAHMEIDPLSTPENITRINQTKKAAEAKYGRGHPLVGDLVRTQKHQIESEERQRLVTESGAKTRLVGNASRDQNLPKIWNSELHATSKYAEGELLESRKLIQAYRRAIGIAAPAAMSPEAMNALKARPITGAFEKPGHAKLPTLKPEEITHYRNQLNAGVQELVDQGKRRLGKLQAGARTRIKTGVLAKTRPSEGADVIGKKTQNAMEFLWPSGPFMNRNSGERKTGQEIIGSYIRPKATKTAKIKAVDRLKHHIETAGEMASGSAIAQSKAKAQVLKSGRIFASGPPEIKTPHIPEGYPHLKKIGIAAGIAGLATAGAIAGKRYLDRREKKMSARNPLIQFSEWTASGLRAIHHPKIPSVPFKTSADYIKGAIGEEPHGLLNKAVANLQRHGILKPQILSNPDEGHYKQAYEKLLVSHTPGELEKSKLAATHEKVSKRRITSRHVIDAHEKGIQEGREAASRAAQEELDEISHGHHQRVTAVISERDAMKKKAARRLIGGIVGAGAAGAGGIAVGRTTKKDHGIQFSAVRRVLDQANPSRDQGTSAHDIATGTIEGGVFTPLLVDPALKAAKILKEAPSERKWGKINPFHEGPGAFGRTAAIGAALGGASTALIGAAVNKVRKQVRKPIQTAQNDINKTFSGNPQPVQFSSPVVVKDRYKKDIRGDEFNRRDANYGRTAAAGAILGGQFRKALRMPIGRAVLAGGAAGVAAQAIIRNAITRKKLDRFGEKTVNAKREEMAPWVAGGLGSIAVEGKRLYSRSPAVRGFIHKHFASRGQLIQMDAGYNPMDDLQKAHRQIYGRPQNTFPTAKAQRWLRDIRRTHRIAGDIHTKASGKPLLDARGRERTPEWRKPWVLGTVGVGLLGAAAMGHKGIANAIRTHGGPGAAELADAVKVMSPKRIAGALVPTKVKSFLQGTSEEIARITDPAQKKIAGVLTDLDPAYKAHKEALAEKVNPKPNLSKVKEIIHGKEFPLSSRIRLIQFATAVPYWDINHRSNKTAVVYAPGSQQRQRREKHPWEKSAFKDAVIGAAGLGVVGGGGFAIHQGRAIRRLRNAGSAEEAARIRRTILTPLANVIPHNFRPENIHASSKLKPIQLESRRDPEERLRDRLTIASKITGTAAGLGVLGATGYGLFKLRKHGPELLSRARNAMDAVKDVSHNAADTQGAIIGIHRDTHSVLGPVAGVFNTTDRALRKSAVNVRVMKRFPGKIWRGTKKLLHLSSGIRPVYFEDKQSRRTAIGSGAVGAIGASQYIGGRAPYEGENITGKRVIRRHHGIPIFQHEGIGIGHGKIAEVYHKGFIGVGNVKATPIGEFGHGNKIRVVDEVGNLKAATNARARLGEKFPYNLITSNCQDFTDSVRGTDRLLSRQLRRATIGGAVAAGVGYGASKLIQRHNKNKQMSSRLNAIRFERKEKGISTGRKIAIGAGLGTAALGAALIPGASKLIGIQAREILRGTHGKLAETKGLRSIIRSPKADPNRGGRMVADYLDASQRFLNQGPQGKVIGAALGHAKANPEGPVAKIIHKIPGSAGDFGISHYARFRSGYREAMNHWDWEVGQMIGQRPAVSALWGNRMKRGVNKSDHIAAEHTELKVGREKTHAAINERLYNYGQNERDAIRHVATKTEDPDIQKYFNKLAVTKSGAAKGYAKKALIIPGTVVAGTGTAAIAAHQPRKRRPLTS